ncbi:hypothetical protein RB597_007534 [Gaeumannomyces tritici]
MAILCKGPVDPLTATWQLSSPLFTACSARRRPDYKYPGQARQRPQKVKMGVTRHSQNGERRARRRKTTIATSKSPPAKGYADIVGMSKNSKNSDPYLPRNFEMEAAKVEEEKPVADVPERPSLQKHEFFFKVPRDYSKPLSSDKGSKTTLHAQIIRAKKGSAKGREARLSDFDPLPTFAYLCGGPGSAQDEGRHQVLTDHVVRNGFQLLLLDYRGTGGSEKLDLERIKDLQASSKDGSSEVVRAFQDTRQGNIVRDLEAIRLYLAASWPTSKHNTDATKLVLLGQSYGGWVAMLYAQRYPESVRGCLLTGGMPPIGASPIEVYNRLFDSVAKDNETFYNDASIRSGSTEDPRTLVLRIAKAILNRPGENKDKNRLSLTTFASMGRSLGEPDGASHLYAKLLKIDKALHDARGKESAASVALDGKTVFDAIDTHTFNKRLIYGVEHEMQCYVADKGGQSMWSAEEVRDDGKYSDRYAWVSAQSAAELDALAKRGSFYFLGEAFMPEHADDYAGLRALGGRKFAERLALAGQTEDLWDVARLKDNKVPIYSTIYPTDMYVDAKLAVRATALVGPSIRFKELDKASGLRHNAIRVATEQLLTVFKGLGCEYFDKTIR